MGLGNAIFLLVLLNIIYSVYSLKSELRQRKSGKIDGHPLQELETDKKPKLRDQKDQTDGPVFLIEPERKLVISDQESNPSLRPEFRDQKPEHKDGPLSESERKQDLSDKESDPGLISEYRDQKDEHKDTPESDSERKPEPRDQESSSTGKPEFRESDSERKPEPRDQEPSSSGKPEFRESDSERKPEPRDQKPSSSGKPEFRGKDRAKAERSAVSKLKFHVYWPNATVPFYVNMDHFDRDQSLSIMTSLSVFAFKTCLKFAPALENPETFGHVLVFENPSGLRRCSISTDGHSMEGPHRVTLGYDCLRSPHIDMMIMRALGFPFEHNRFIRDNFIHVELDNVDPGSIQLFTKEATLPEELRFIPYDYDSVLHFGERDFSKNGHRTIIFKDANIQQNRVGLTPTDLRKLEIIYGPECRSRDRQEKIELCQSYPGVAQVRRKRHAEIEDPIEDMQLDRKKRHIDVDALDMMTPYDLDNSQIDRKKRHVEPEKLEAADKKPESDPITLQNLRVNRDITPPPEVVLAVPRAVDTILKELNIESNVQDLVENVYKISATALENVREKYCNRTKNVLRTTATEEISTVTKPDILGVVEVVANYANLIVERATQNLTAFCESSLPVEKYQRCGWNQNCVPSWKSTKTGDLFFSTQHRPYLPISTNYPPRFGHQYARSGNATEANNLTTTTEKARRKREIDEKDEKEDRSQTEYNDRKKIVLSALVNEIKSQKNDTQGSSSGETETTQATNVLEDPEEVNATKIGDAKPISRKDDTATTNDDSEKKDGFDATSDPSDSTYPPNGTTKEDANIDGRKSASWVRVEGKEVRGKNKNPYKILEESSLSLEEENTRQPLKYKSKKQIHPGRNHITSNTEKPKGKDQRVDSQQHDKGRANIRHDEPKPKRRNAKPNVRLSDSAETEGRTKENSMEEKAPQQDYRNPQIQKQGKFLLHGERREGEGNRKSNRPLKFREKIPKQVQLSKANIEYYEERWWPSGVAKYIISDEEQGYDLEDLRRRLEEVNLILKKKTCVRIEEISEQYVEDHDLDDYLVLDTSPDYVTGRVGGRQPFGCIELFKGGQHRQYTAMMVMAMLGFYFEVSRHDRDEHIRVHMRHIRPDKLHHFEKIKDDATFPLPYDYESATHPAWQFWRKIGRSGIASVATYKAKDPTGNQMRLLGQHRKLLSENDIVKLNSIYGVKCFRTSRRSAFKIIRNVVRNRRRKNKIVLPTPYIVVDNISNVLSNNSKPKQYDE